MEIKYLVETALLTHGLISASNEDLISAFNGIDANLVWVDCGKIKIGTIEEYIPMRDRSSSLIRIDCSLLEEAVKEKLSGALTASGTMAVCQKMGIPLAVTCGMGGIGDIRNEKLCPDLPALAEMEVTLISTSPKDMLDIGATLRWLKNNGVTVLGNGTDICTGYVFSLVKEKIDGVAENNFSLGKGHTLLLNPIPEGDRIADPTILQKAIQKGIEAESLGKYYHPAVNGEIDRLTNGYSTKIQLKSIVSNALWAKSLSSSTDY